MPERLLNSVGMPKHLEVSGKKIRILPAIPEDITGVIRLLRLNDSDVRGLSFTASDSFEARCRASVEFDWAETMLALSKKVSSGQMDNIVYRQILIQSLGIVESNFISDESRIITDPFNARIVESGKSLDELREQNIPNILVAKDRRRVVGVGRLLDVEGSCEMVSLVVDEDYRNMRIGGELVSQRLQRSTRWPMYSFVSALAESRPGSSLVSYYLKLYEEYNADIPPYEDLPYALQRDLARMNAFWGSNLIIRIKGHSK